MDAVTYLNKYQDAFQSDESKEIVRKAIMTTAATSGGPFIPEDLEQIPTLTTVRLVPELGLPSLRKSRKYHEFNRITALPGAGSGMGEASTTPSRTGTSERTGVNLKVMKRKGGVSGFQEDAAEGFIDSLELEMNNHLNAMGNDLRTYLYFGNKDADAYTFDGLDKFIATNRENLSGAAQVWTDLTYLDKMVDKSNRKQGLRHRRAFMVSPEMLSKISSLWTTVRDTRPADAPEATFHLVKGGVRLYEYRGIPFIETTGLTPTAKMTTVAVAGAGGGGAITDDTYYFRVAPVTWDGEQGAYDEVSVTTSSNDTITLSWTAYSGALYYKIYASLATGEETLYDVISAFTYDGDGTITGNVASHVFTADPAVDTSAVPTHMQNDTPLDYTAGKPNEIIILWDLDEIQGLGKLAYTNSGGSVFRGLVTTEPLAKVDDREDFLIKSYCALIDAFEATSYMIRGVKVAA